MAISLINPRKPPLAASSFNRLVTSLPLSVSVRSFSRAPAGALTSTSASPPLTISGRDDSVLISSRVADWENMSALKVDRILTTTNAMAAVWRDCGATFVANFMVASLRSRSCEIPGAAAGAAERRGKAEIKVEDEEEEKRRVPSFPFCETSAFCGVYGGEFVLLTFSLGA